MLAIYLAALDSADNAEAFEAVYERYKRLVYTLLPDRPRPAPC